MGSGLDQCLSPAQRADLDRRKIRTLRGIPNPPDPSSCTEASWIRQSYRSSSCHAPLPSLGLGYAGDRTALRDCRRARRGRLDTERCRHRKIASGSIAPTRSSSPIRCPIRRRCSLTCRCFSAACGTRSARSIGIRAALLKGGR